MQMTINLQNDKIKKLSTKTQKKDSDLERKLSRRDSEKQLDYLINT